MIEGRYRRSRAGFTVAEMMIVLVLLVTMVVGALISGRKGLEQADTKALADILVASLRAARQQAITEGHPVSLVLPSDSGTKPHSQGFLIVEGHAPLLTSAHSFASEHPDSCLAVGIVDAAASVDKPQLALAGDSFDFPSWVAASGRGSDYIFCFLPDGSLVTNDLPLSAGSYHILVSSGLRYTGGASLPGVGWGVSPTYFRLDEGAASRLVSLSPLGEVVVEGSAPGVARAGRLEFQSPPAALPSLPTSVAGTDPVLLDIDVFPVPDTANLPPGIEALVDVKEHLSLKVTARDSDPERRLHCNWVSDRGGPFSRPDAHPMEWEQDAGGPGIGAWVSRVEWRPPPGSGGGEIFELSALVSDPTGGTDGDQLGVTGRVQTVQRSKIVFTSQRGGTNGVYSMLSDGSDVTFLCNGRNAVLSPLGDQIFYAAGDSLYLRPIGGTEAIHLATMAQEPFYDPSISSTIMGSVRPNGINAKGDLLFWSIGNSAYVAEFNGFSPVVPYRLNGDPGFLDANGDRHVEMSVSPGGDYVAYDDGFHLYVADFNENGPPYLTGGSRNVTNLFMGGESAGNASWSSDGRKLTFHGNNGGNIDLAALDFDPATGVLSNPRFLTNDAANDDSVSVSPDGTQLVFSKQLGGNWDIFRMNLDGSNPVNLTADNPGADLAPVWGR